MPKIAIIGAGLSGLTLAHKLSAYGQITIFEKSRGLGGRIATRRAGDYHFDHGAQFFTVKTKAFKDFLLPLIEQSIIQRWDARFAEYDGQKRLRSTRWNADYPHFVGSPSMSAICHALNDDFDIRLNTQVMHITHDVCWKLWDASDKSLGEYDWVISTAPPAQSVKLLTPDFLYHTALSAIEMLPCFSLMLGYREPLDLDFDVALIGHADISWISVNASKPEREDPYTLLIHSTNRYAQAHIDDAREKVLQHLLAVASQVTGHALDQADHIDLHGWRYANLPKQNRLQSYIDPANKLAACGDWCLQGRIEAAFLSAVDTVERLIPYL